MIALYVRMMEDLVDDLGMYTDEMKHDTVAVT